MSKARAIFEGGDTTAGMVSRPLPPGEGTPGSTDGQSLKATDSVFQTLTGTPSFVAGR